MARTQAKAPKAVKRGDSWRCQVMVDGESKSFTAKTPEEAIAKAMSWKSKMEEACAPAETMTIGAAIDRYIESKDAVLSVSTINGYKKIKRNYFLDIQKKSIKTITADHIQRSVNAMAKQGLSPKTIANAHGLLASVLDEYRPGMVLRTRLPQKEKREIVIPSDEEIRRIMEAAHETPLELPIALAAFMGLRISEICGLSWENIKDGKAHIKEAVVYNGSGYTSKRPKSYSGDRIITIPQIVIDLLPRQGEGRIIKQTSAAIHSRWYRMLDAEGIQRFNFHSLRHYYASSLIVQGIPYKYITERMGHATENMIKNVYGHTFKSEQDRIDHQINAHFNTIFSPTISPEFQKTTAYQCFWDC